MGKVGRISIIAVLVSIFSQSLAQFDRPVRFDHFTVNDGLLSNTIREIVQDSEGFLWIGTSTGLNRYDGYEFAPFRPPSGNLLQSDPNIMSLCSTKEHLWIGTPTSIERLDLNTYSFKTYQYATDNVTTGCITQTPDGNVWFGKWGNGLLRWNALTDSIETISVPMNMYLTVFSLHATQNGTLWVGTEDNGLYYYNNKTNQLLHYLIPSDQDNSQLKRISSIYEADSVLYLATHGNGVFMLNLKDRLLSPLSQINHRAPNLQFTKIVGDKLGNIWFAGDKSGIVVFNPKTKQLAHIENIAYDHTSISGNVVKALYIDREMNLWAGVDQKGLNRSNILSQTDFAFFSPFDPKTFNHQIQITALHTKTDNSAWMASQENGLFYMPQGQYQHTKHVNLPLLMDKATITALIENNKEELIFSVYPNQLYIASLDYSRALPKISQLIPIDIGKNDIRIIVPAKNTDCYWLATDGQGLILWNQKQGIIKTFERRWPLDTLTLPGNYIYKIERLSTSHLLVAANEGFAILDEETMEIKSFNHLNIGNISDFRIKSFNIDQQGNFLISTPAGLFIDKTGKEKISKIVTGSQSAIWHFEPLHLNTELHGLLVNGLIEDEQGITWGTSENGILRLDLHSNTATRFDHKNGIGGNIFVANAAKKLSNGVLLMPATHGFSIVFPASTITTKALIYPVLVRLFMHGTEIEPGTFHNGRQVLQKKISKTDTLVLKAKENTFALEFSALSFTQSNNIHYQYMLFGFDKQWQNASNFNSAIYTNINPGTYTFMLKASNNGEQWIESQQTLTILIKSPFWATWWFLLILLTLIFAAFRLIIHIREIRQKSIQKELEKQVQMRTEELSVKNHDLLEKTNELKKTNEVKDTFFNIIAHDLINPVSSSYQLLELIEHRLDTMTKPELEKLLNSAYKSTGQTLDLLMNLLMWARAQSDRIAYNPKKLEINMLVNDVLGHIKQQAKQKDITIYNNIDRPSYCYADDNTVQTIFRNLLSNAIKFSFEGSQIFIGAQKENDKIKFFVRDKGTGMDQESLDNLFVQDITKKGTKGEKGSGLGLKLCRQFVIENGGTIWAESIVGTGTTFWFSLPMAH